MVVEQEALKMLMRRVADQAAVAVAVGIQTLPQQEPVAVRAAALLSAIFCGVHINSRELLLSTQLPIYSWWVLLAAG